MDGSQWPRKIARLKLPHEILPFYHTVIQFCCLGIVKPLIQNQRIKYSRLLPRPRTAQFVDVSAHAQPVENTPQIEMDGLLDTHATRHSY